MGLDLPDPVQMYQIRYRTVPDPLICQDWWTQPIYTALFTLNVMLRSHFELFEIALQAKKIFFPVETSSKWSCCLILDIHDNPGWMLHLVGVDAKSLTNFSRLVLWDSLISWYQCFLHDEWDKICLMPSSWHVYVYGRQWLSVGRSV